MSPSSNKRSLSDAPESSHRSAAKQRTEDQPSDESLSNTDSVAAGIFQDSDAFVDDSAVEYMDHARMDNEVKWAIREGDQPNVHVVTSP